MRAPHRTEYCHERREHRDRRADVGQRDGDFPLGQPLARDSETDDSLGQQQRADSFGEKFARHISDCVVDETLGADAASGVARAENIEWTIVQTCLLAHQSVRGMNAELAGQIPANSRVARIAGGADSRGTRS